MANSLCYTLFAVAGFVAIVVIVWEVYRHWDDIVRLSREDGDTRPVWIEWRIIATPDDEDLDA